ncbi:hypothetical protein RR46_01814 [Papilio xuthus]|uniref:Uncharacterized protein n=1 Tax=Papilio xuthus TaxID=66420 RepID=A0A194QN13_PAPXU|nr:hypothetical protein RR46_01814 [Papilio xuthus]
MLLIIHNLPTKVLKSSYGTISLLKCMIISALFQIRYSEVKALIRDRCNLNDLIVDNLVYESPQSRKVTIGLSDENDAIAVTKELHGLVFMGQKLHVEDLRRNKGPSIQNSNPDQGYGRNISHNNASEQTPMKPHTTPVSYSAPYYMAGQDQNQGSSKGQSTDGHGQPPVQPISAVPQYMQNNPYSTPYFMYDQGSPTYSAGKPKSSNVMTQPAYGSPRMQMPQGSPTYSTGMPQSSNMMTQPPYGSPRMPQDSPTYPTGMPHSSNMMTQPPYGSPRMPMPQNTNMGYGESSNYGNNQPMTVTSNQPEYIPRGNDNPRNEYSKRDSGSRYFEEKNDQKYHDRSERPSTSRGDRDDYEPRSRSDERRHGDWSPDRYRRSENRNFDHVPKNSRDSYNQSSDRSYKSEPEGSDFRRGPDDRRNANNSANFGADYNRHYDKEQGDYNRPSDRAPGNTNENSRYKWTKQKNGNEYKKDNVGDYINSKPSTSKGVVYSRNDFNPHNKFGKIQDPTVPEINEPAIYLTKAEFKKIRRARELKRSAADHKNETWRGQATSKIVKTALEESGLMIQAKKPGFVQFMKSIVRTRINKMLGYRVTVPMEKIIEEYNTNYPPNVRKNFVLESKAKFNKITDFPSGAAPIRRPLMNQATPEKRPATEQPPSAPAPKKPQVNIPRPPPYRPPTPGPLPKYPNAELKTLAKEEHEKEIYTLEPKLKEALDSEVKVLRELVIKLDITKRLLNVTCNLPLRMFANGKFKVKEIGPMLKPYGIISCRKSPRSKLCVVVCQDYPEL